MEIRMVVDDQIYQALVIRELKHEARLSDRQIRMAEWNQFHDGMIQTWRDREVKLSNELFNAIASLPVSGRKVFKIERPSLLLDMPTGPEREAPPVITDEKELLAKLIAEKLLN